MRPDRSPGGQGQREICAGVCAEGAGSVVSLALESGLALWRVGLLSRWPGQESPGLPQSKEGNSWCAPVSKVRTVTASRPWVGAERATKTSVGGFRSLLSLESQCST